MNAKLVTLVLLLSGLGACSEEAPQAPAPTAPLESAAPVQQSSGILTSSQQSALESASEVGSVLEAADAERRRQMKAQGL